MYWKSTPFFAFIFKALIESFQFFHVMICNGPVKVEPPLDALRHFEKPILGSRSVCIVWNVKSWFKNFVSWSNIWDIMLNTWSRSVVLFTMYVKDVLQSNGYDLLGQNKTYRLFLTMLLHVLLIAYRRISLKSKHVEILSYLNFLCIIS